MMRYKKMQDGLLLLLLLLLLQEERERFEYEKCQTAAVGGRFKKGQKSAARGAKRI